MPTHVVWAEAHTLTKPATTVDFSSIGSASSGPTSFGLSSLGSRRDRRLEGRLCELLHAPGHRRLPAARQKGQGAPRTNLVTGRGARQGRRSALAAAQGWRLGVEMRLAKCSGGGSGSAGGVAVQKGGRSSLFRGSESIEKAAAAAAGSHSGWRGEAVEAACGSAAADVSHMRS